MYRRIFILSFTITAFFITSFVAHAEDSKVETAPLAQEMKVEEANTDEIKVASKETYSNSYKECVKKAQEHKENYMNTFNACINEKGFPQDVLAKLSDTKIADQDN